jgi:hypothetical protein
MKTPHERQQEKKRERLAEMEQQVKTGRLVIRKMTDEERLELAAARTAKDKRG